uniref:DDE-1 domain-containing protein n=1 Tax=Rhabditophanes sp. KR3021 TaxID=114890 RepID=A0AC35TL60_9BILA
MQPLDQGIIRSFKAFYRKAMVSKIIENIELHERLSEFTKEITLLDAIRFTVVSWNNVTETTIQNCFIKAGFCRGNNEMSEESIEVFEDLSNLINGASLNDVIGVDDNVITDELDDFDEDFGEAILTNYLGNNNDLSDDEDNVVIVEERLPIMTRVEFKNNLKRMKEYIHEKNPSLLNCFEELEKQFSSTYISSLTQKRLTDFWKN